ncbi:MAG: helix-hairpin-helix domain-containing protein [bacterium]
MTKPRRLIDLVSVGPAFVQVFEDLGITEVRQLVDKDHVELFEELQRLKGRRVDPCVYDVFQAAIAQARDPNLPPEKCRWPYWSRLRKSRCHSG